ncbi:MAG: GDP-mannose 4,6-dehydratase [Gemmatimonadota bacterium]|nr:MAG: GDP-mannose 4,6-dehydratase [Gemmatimonadota bacterium]
MKALVTGVAGFIGSHVAQELITRGFEVIGIDSFEGFYPRRLKESNMSALRGDGGFTFLEENILDVDFGQLLSRVEYVFHLAAQAGVRSSWGTHFDIYAKNNILATQKLLEAATACPLKRFIFTSSSSVYGDTNDLPMREDAACRPVSPYGVSKLAAEHLCHLYWKSYDVPVVALRLFSVYGPRQRPDMAFHKFIKALLRDDEFEVYGDGSSTRDYTFVSDVTEAHLLALDATPGEVLNVGGGSRVSLRGVVETLGDLLGRAPKIKWTHVQKGDVRHTWADLSKIEELLHYRPKVQLEEGLQREMSWVREVYQL